MSDLGVLTAIRTLNFARREHPATYCALRMLLDNIADGGIESWLDAYLPRRASTLRYSSQWRYPVYKGVGIDGRAEYRRCQSPSPSSLLAEVYAISLLARSPEFASHRRVYSYRWAQPDAPHIFEHFYDGYQQRDIDIALACETIGAGARVVVSDIKSYYASVPMERARPIIDARVAASDLADSEKQTIQFAISTYFSDWNSKLGVPIGAPIGHVLGNFYLHDLDQQLSAAYGDSYFRYVDDIVVVCDFSEVDAVRSTIEAAIQNCGLRHHPDKNDVVLGTVWREHAAQVKAQSERDPVAGVRRDIRVWTDRMRDVTPLRNALRGAGTSLSITPLRKRPERLLERLASRVHDQTSKIAIPRLIGRISSIRDGLWSRLRSMDKSELSESGFTRKWQVQNVRYTSNRLMQLVAHESHGALLDQLPKLDELAPIRAAAQALSKGDATQLLEFPGPIVSSVARMWVAANATPMELDLKIVTSSNARRVVFDLWLHGAVEPNAEWARSLPNSERRFGMFAADIREPRRTGGNYNYIDEICSLQMGSSESCRAKLASRNNEF